MYGVAVTWPRCCVDFLCVRYMDFQELLQCFFAIVMSAMSSGENASMAADQAAADKATESIFKLLDTKSKIDPYSEGVRGSDGLSPLFVSTPLCLHGGRERVPRWSPHMLPRLSAVVGCGNSIFFRGPKAGNVSRKDRVPKRLLRVSPPSRRHGAEGTAGTCAVVDVAAFRLGLARVVSRT